MMSLAQRVRDFRYSKGWGPDELASRAEISRTAIYQIEKGKTGSPHANTLRRIAVALDVSTDELLGHPESTAHQTTRTVTDHAVSASHGREYADWMPADGELLALPANSSGSGNNSHFTALNENKAKEPRFGVEAQRRSLSMGFDTLLLSEGELMSKLHDLLHSPLGAGIRGSSMSSTRWSPRAETCPERENPPHGLIHQVDLLKESRRTLDRRFRASLL